MLHPVGHQNPSVYWRRRLLIAGSAVVLIALIVVTVRVLTSKDSGPASAGAFSGSPAKSPSTSAPASTPSTSHSPSSSASSSASSGASSGGSGSASRSPSAPASSTVALLPCTSKQLAVTAVTSKPSYSVGTQLTLSMQVTNIGSVACTQNLADSQVVLSVYNGESRVWGSHDCEIAPGTDVRTLGRNMPVRISVVWSGRSSQAKCAGIRQQVGAGNYTLYASLAGKTGTAASFAIK